MVLEKEVNIFEKNAFENKFKSIDTSLNIQNGKISAVITEAEYKELIDKKQTLYKKTAQTEMTAEKINWLIESGESKTDFTLTDRTAELLTESLIVKNKDGSKTIISGGRMDIDEIFTQDITATGTITGATLKGGTVSGTDIVAKTMTANEAYTIYNGSISQKIIYYNGEDLRIGLISEKNDFKGAGFQFATENGMDTIFVYGNMQLNEKDIICGHITASRLYTSESVYTDGIISTSSEYQSQKDLGLDWRFGSGTGSGDSRWFGFYDATYGFHGGIYGPEHILRMGGEIQSTYPNAFRAVYGSRGFIIRNDGAAVYFMGTNDDPYGSWNDNYTVFYQDTGQWLMKKADQDGMNTNRGYPVLSDTDARVYSISYNGTSYMKVRIGTSTTYHCAFSNSDVRLKENVFDTNVSNALDVVNSIKLRMFDWKKTHIHQNIGFIADELELLDPGLTQGGGYDENGNMDVKSIDTLYLLGYVVKAIQELSARMAQ